MLGSVVFQRKEVNGYYTCNICKFAFKRKKWMAIRRTMFTNVVFKRKEVDGYYTSNACKHNFF